MLPQIYVAPAPPLVVNHSFNSARFPWPSHCTVLSVASIPILGAVVSLIVKVAVDSEELPHSSVAIKVIVAVPVSAHPSLSPE